VVNPEFTTLKDFSQSTIEYLTKAGWYAGRKVSLIKYRAYLCGEGYTWFPKVAAFLEEFGDLLLSYSNKGGESTLTFDACHASASYDSRWVTDEYAQRLGRSQLCIIGELSGHMLLFMNDLGQVYGGYDDILCFFGNSGIEAIEAICSDQRELIKEIP
jgi:hypothetical protein